MQSLAVFDAIFAVMLSVRTVEQFLQLDAPVIVTGKPLDSPEKGNVDKMSEKCRKNVEKLSGGAERTIFGHCLDNFCLFGRCFCLVTLSNARPLQTCHIRARCRRVSVLNFPFQQSRHFNKTT